MKTQKKSMSSVLGFPDSQRKGGDESAEKSQPTAAVDKSDDKVDPIFRGFLALCGGRNLRIAFVCLLISTGVCLGILYAYWESTLSQARRAAAFQSDSERMGDSLVRAFSQYVVAVAVGHNYMKGFADVGGISTRAGFSSFAEVFIGQGLPFYVMVFVPRVLASERKAVEINAESYWTPYFADNGIDRNYTGILGVEPDPSVPGGFALVPSPERERYYPVHFFHPVAPYLGALDFDLYAFEMYSKPIDAARFSGKPVLARRMLRGQETSPYAFSVLLYWPGQDPEDDLVIMIVRIPDIMSSAFTKLQSGIEVYLYDNITSTTPDGDPEYEFLGGHIVGTSDDNDKFLLPETNLSTVLASATTNVLVNSQTIAFADRSWIFVTRSTASYQRADVTSRVVGGTLLSMLGLLIAGWYVMDVRMHERVSKHQAAHRIREATAAAMAERRVNAFVAHEVRNPLSVALTANRFTLTKVQEAVSWPDEDAKHCVLHDANLVQASLTFIHELLDNIVDINQFARRKLTMNSSCLSLRDHVFLRVQCMLGGESMVGGNDQSNKQQQQQQQESRLVVDTGDDPLWTIVDGTRLVQVVLNLVKNAMRLAPDGLITLSAHRKADPEKGVVIQVRDTGPGVPDNIRANLFDKSTVDLSHQNTGVGLHLCQCIIMSMDGRIYLDESYNSGVANFPGACFVVDLPIPWVATPGTPDRMPLLIDKTKEETVSPVVLPSETPVDTVANMPSPIVLPLDSKSDDLDISINKGNSGNNIKIPIMHTSSDASRIDIVNVARRCLIIDDDAVVRAMLKRQLKVCFPNWKIETVDSGEAALGLVKPKTAGGLGLQFDVCLVDQYMPGPNNPMTGDQVIGAMRNINMAGYRIGCSANQVEALHVSAGADGFIRKPADNAALREVVKRVFASPPLRSCLLIGKSKTVRAELKNRLKGAVAPNCVFKEAESVDAAVEMAQTSHPRDGGVAEGGIELIVVDEVSCISGMVLASEVAKRLRHQVSPGAKVVIAGGVRDASASGGSSNSSISSSGKRPQPSMPMGFNLAWPRPLPLAGVMRADLMRVLLPSGGGGCGSTTMLATDGGSGSSLLLNKASKHHQAEIIVD